MSVSVRPPNDRKTLTSVGGTTFGGFNLIPKLAVECLERDRITRSNIAQRTKERVAVAGQGDIA